MGTSIAMILWGWLRKPILLGSKLDQCAQCDVVGPHALLRTTYWLHIFRLPVILFWLSHRLVCANCGKQSELSFSQLWRGMRTGTLPLPGRPRPAWSGMQDAIWSQSGNRPSEAEFFDPITRNPNRGLFDLYVKAWPVLVAAVFVFAIMLPKQFAQVTGQPEQYGAAHTCWSDTPSGETLTGCRYADGSVWGQIGTYTVVCYFEETVPATTNKVTCP